MGVQFDKHSARRIAKAVRRLERTYISSPIPMDERLASDLRWVPFRNDSGQTATARGVLCVTGTTHVNNEVIYTVTRATTAKFYRTLAINAPEAVSNGSYGLCTFEGPVEATFDSGTPAQGEVWGAKPGQFTLSRYYPGFLVMGTNAGTTMAVVCPEPITHIIGETDSSSAVNSTVTVSIYAGAAGSEADTDWNVGCYNKFAGVAASKTMGVAWIGGQAYLVAAEC